MKKSLLRLAAPQIAPTLPLGTSRTRRARLAGVLALLGVMAGLGLAASRPAHTAGGPIAVNVANTPLAVLSRDSDDPARNAVGGTIYLASSVTGSYNIGDTLYKVPAGKRLVIEHLSSSAYNRNDANGYTISVYTVQGGTQVETYFDEVPDAAPFPSASIPVRLYGDPGTSVDVGVAAGNKNPAAITISFSGYLVDAT